MKLKKTFSGLITAVLLGSATPALANEGIHQRSDVRAFMDQMVDKHDFKRAELERVFSEITIRQDILDAISSPAEGKAWHQYRPIFVTEKRTLEGAAFFDENREALVAAENKYGVSAYVIAAIIGVESRYGRHKGKYRVAEALATLGFEYPKRSKFFRSELEHLMLLSREESFDPLALMGSYAGAMGKPQFISSSYRSYAVDFDGDGVRDLLNNSSDAIGSVANYLARHGWERNQLIAVEVKDKGDATAEKRFRKPNSSVAQLRAQGIKPAATLPDDLKAGLIALENQTGHEYWLGTQNFYAITRYNHSSLYAMAVFQLSEAIKQADSEARRAGS